MAITIKWSIHLEVPSEPNSKSKLQEKGYFVDFNVFKKFIKAECDKWDEHVLLPADHPDMKIKKNGPSLEIQFRERFYVFPANEVILLPITNTSVEQLSRILAENFLNEFKKYGVTRIRVRVEETRGQGASTIIQLES